MSGTLDSTTVTIVIAAWCAWYGWAIHKSVTLYDRTNSGEVQYQITDIWGAFPGLLGAFYLMFSQINSHRLLDTLQYGLLIASQVAGVLICVYRLGRIQPPVQSRIFRAFIFVINGIFHTVCSILIMFFGLSIAGGFASTACFLPLSWLLLVYLFKGVLDD